MSGLKRPLKSKAAGKTYKIVYKAEGTVHHEDGTECTGLSDHRKQQILIEEGQTLDNECDTMIHEVLHQLMTAYGVKIPDELEEMVCSTMGSALFAHVRENPDFWRYIFKAALPPKPRGKRSGSSKEAKSSGVEASTDLGEAGDSRGESRTDNRASHEDARRV